MAEVLQYLKEVSVLGLSLDRIALAFAVILASLILKRILSTLILDRLISLAARTRTQLDDLLIEAVRRPVETGIILAGISIGVGILALPTDPVNVRKFVHVAMIAAITVVVAWLFFRLIDAFATYFESAAAETESKLDDALVPLFRKALKVFVGVLAFIVVVQNLGYSVSGILAGLGIGGLALALAAKDTLANIFGSITILIDRPFKVGDWVRGPNFEGVVEDIGFRSTRIRTFPKTLLSVPNNQMINMVVDNQQQMPMRRMDIEVGVTYDTNAAQMRRALQEIEEIVKSTEGAASEGMAVRFHDFGASSLVIKIKCFTRAIDYNNHSQIRQELLLAIMEKLEKLELEIAFPSQTLYFGKGQALAPQDGTDRHAASP
jgi:MscS family membrane protein